jgi:shikimate dehydrogenase
VSETAGARASRVRGDSRVVGVIGWPVRHSLSPVIHNAAFESVGLPWVYVPLPVPPGGVPAAIEGLRALGFAGANVTMPHKTEFADLLADLSEDARRLRAVNTVVADAEGVAGHNTDAPGFVRFLRRDAGFDPAGRSVLLFGAGGAARACALALAQEGAASVSVALRDPRRAEGVREVVDGFGTEVRAMEMSEAPEVRADLVVNATPLGVHGESLPLPPVGPGIVVVDLLYQPAVTPLIATARDAGARGFGGLGLLLHQAALSFGLWTGQPAPLSVMSAAALAALSEPTSGGRPPAQT